MSLAPNPIGNRSRWTVFALGLAVLAGGAGQAAAQGPGHRLGYAWADQPAAASYTPHPTYSYNSSGEAIGITRSGTGTYEVRFVGLGGAGVSGGQVQATAYGGPGFAYCTVRSWLSAGADVVVYVRCYEIGPADSRFQVWVAWPVEAGRRLGYTWVASDGSTTFSLPYSYNGGGGAITAARVGTGRYSVRFAGLGGGALAGGNVQVTGYGAGFHACKVEGWASSGSDFTAAVRCNDPWGWPMDGAFDVLALWPEGLEGDGVRLGYVWANDPVAASYSPSARYAHNSGGGAITITRGSTGRYVVRFRGLGGSGLQGTVLATAYGSTGDSCKVLGWGSAGTDFVASVSCHDGSRLPVDTRFTLLVTRVP